jgi:hypothetical protein
MKTLMSTNKTGAGGEHRFRAAFRKAGKRICIPVPLARDRQSQSGHLERTCILCLQREIAGHKHDIR